MDERLDVRWNGARRRASARDGTRSLFVTTARIAHGRGRCRLLDADDLALERSSARARRRGDDGGPVGDGDRRVASRMVGSTPTARARAPSARVSPGTHGPPKPHHETAHAFAFGWKRVRWRDVPPRLGELERRARAESSESEESRARGRDDGLRARRVARSLDLARASRRADASVFVAAIAVIAADDDARVSSRSRRRGRRATRARVSTARLGLLLRVRADVRGARRSSPLAVVGNFKSTVERIHAHDARSRVRRLTTSATPSLALTFFARRSSTARFTRARRRR